VIQPYIIIGIYLLMVIAFSITNFFIFYHIGRYSLIGDASKRVFIIYLLSTYFVIILGFIGVIVYQII